MNIPIKAGVLFKFFAIVVLVALSVLLVRGLKFTLAQTNPEVANFNGHTLRNFTCPKNEEYVIVTACLPCTAYESKHKEECKKTGNIEKMKCPSSENIFSKSCPFSPTHEAKKFWIFEGCMFGLSLLSNLLVWYRRRSNDVYMYQRLKRQISDVRECDTSV